MNKERYALRSTII